jgi:hypothetical protein
MPHRLDRHLDLQLGSRWGATRLDARQGDQLLE